MAWLGGLSRDAYVNLMDQYYPAGKVITNPRFAEINRRVTRLEMVEGLRAARDAGLWRLDTRWREVSPLGLLPIALGE
jgi:putative pyruvate formate lyase activating enzyme